MQRHCRRGRHHGTWELVSNESTPGALDNGGLLEFESARGEIGLRMLLGITNLAQRCSNCGWVEVTTITGKVAHIYEHVQGR